MNKDSKQTYWFKRRRYGYGWTPVTWQGWLTIIIFLAVLLGGAFILRNTPQNELTTEVGIYLGLVVAATIGLLIVSRKKGPTPAWRWGKRDTDDSNEDF